MVAVVEVRDVGVGVDHGSVSVSVAVWGRPGVVPGVVVVVVVWVVVAVFVLVLARFVSVSVFVGRFEGDGAADGGDGDGGDLGTGDGFVECGPGEEGARKGAVAKTSWPRAAPRSRAPLTHSTMDAP